MTEATASLLIFVQLHALPTRTDGGLYSFYFGNSSNPFQNILLVCLASVLIAMVVVVVVWIALVCKRLVSRGGICLQRQKVVVDVSGGARQRGGVKRMLCRWDAWAPIGAARLLHRWRAEIFCDDSLAPPCIPARVGKCHFSARNTMITARSSFLD
ncbi:hypothetical protein L1887_53930 [Cichorium endivia]|nr:hypothetical protein L1887_53930 [Cichorium endivia]